MSANSFSEIVSELRKGLRDGLLSSIEKRKSVLNSIITLCKENEEAIVEALYKDLHKCRMEAISTDILPCISEASCVISNLDTWLKDERVPSSIISMLDTVFIQRQPYGVVLIITPWNFPFNLTFLPLIGALASGNTALIKPSENSPATASIIASLIPKYIDKYVVSTVYKHIPAVSKKDQMYPVLQVIMENVLVYLLQRICQVVCGEADVCRSLLENEKFDLVFFTGGTNVGREVYTAAAKKLTPVLLELGGKCPVFVDADVSLTMTVKRILSAKLLNAGQVCIAPDYVLCHEEILPQFKQAICTELKSFLGDDPHLSPDFGRIINNRHFQRIKSLIDQTKGKIIFGGDSDSTDKYIGPTFVADVQLEDILMQDELFAPILPIVTVKSHSEAINIINSKAKPLAVYVFTQNTEIFDQFRQNTSSGAIMQNDCLIHVAIPNLPFGGVGASGIGNYHGRYSINSFSHHRSVVLKSTVEMFNNKIRYAPYDENKLSWFRWLFDKSDKRTCQIL